MRRARGPFRDAYRQVGLDIEAGRFVADKTLHHTHAGSIGNLCNDHITALMDDVCNEFDFAQVERSLETLLNS